MSRFTRTLSLIFTLGLFLASCRPQTADRRPQADGGPLFTPSPVPTLTPTPAPTLTPTPTPTPDLAEVLGAPAEVARVEMVNENLALGYDADGNLVSWYGAKDRLWYTGQELRFVPEIMQMHGEPVPAIIEFVAEEGSQDAEAVRGGLREIDPRFVIGEIIHCDDSDSTDVSLDPVTLVHRRTERVVVFPGDDAREETLYQVYETFAYRAGGRVHLIQAPVRGIVNTVVGETHDQFYLLTPESIQKLPSIGSRQFVILRIAVNTMTPDMDGWQRRVENYCYSTPHPTACIFAFSWRFQRLYSVEEVRDLIYNSSGLVVLEGGHIDTIFPRP
jgi:hypothetical protein